MGRGRTIDKTLPLTRSLTAQRDYRARKSAHLKQLENTVSRLTEENAALRAKVAALRARVPPPDELPPEQLEAVAVTRGQLLCALSNLDSIMGGEAYRQRSWPHQRNEHHHHTSHRHHNHHQHGYPVQNQPPSRRGSRHVNPYPPPRHPSTQLQALPASTTDLPTTSATGSEHTPAQPLPELEPEPEPELGLDDPNIIDLHPGAASGMDGECCFGLIDCSNPLGVPPSHTKGGMADGTGTPRPSSSGSVSGQKRGCGSGFSAPPPAPPDQHAPDTSALGTIAAAAGRECCFGLFDCNGQVKN